MDLTCSIGEESASDELELEEELEEYFLARLDTFLDDFLLCFEDFFLSNLLFFLVEEGLTSRSSEDGDLLACLAFILFTLWDSPIKGRRTSRSLKSCISTNHKIWYKCLLTENW